MSGYREHSFDPNAYEQLGKPLRPYNWVQWTGVALAVVGIAGYLAYFASRLGWIDIGFDNSNAPPFFTLPLLGMMLVSSRREPGTRVGSEQLARNRKVLLITVGVVAAILGAATVIAFSGA
jgi:hypothetical protein